MGDSGALLLGFTLAAVSVQGLSKTAALTALVLPLLVLAVPLIDTSFVVAKRIKHGRPSTSPTARTSTTASRTSASRSAGRSSTSTPGARRSRSPRSRPASSIPTPTATGTRSNVALDALIGLLAIGASIYVVYLLEIVKLANPFIRRRAGGGARTKSSEKPHNRRFALLRSATHCAARLRYAAARWSRPSPARFPLSRRARS